MDAFQFLGTPKQARTVPTVVERVAEGQAAIVKALMKYTFDAFDVNQTITYYRLTEDNSAPGLPDYGFIVKMLVQTVNEHFIGAVDAPVWVVKARFGERGFVDRHERTKSAGGYAYPITWALRIPKSLMDVFEAQELPSFEHNDFDRFMSLPISLGEPMFPYDFQILKETLETCGAVVSIEQVNSRRLSVVMPGTVRSVFEPDTERIQYIQECLARWDVLTLGPVRQEGYRESPGESLRSGYKFYQSEFERQRGEDPPFTIEKADDLFVGLKVGQAMREQVLEASPVRITGERCNAVFGPPSGMFMLKDNEKEMGWIYRFKMEDALVVIEGQGDVATALFAVPGQKSVARNFEKLITVLRG